MYTHTIMLMIKGSGRIWQHKLIATIFGAKTIFVFVSFLSSKLSTPQPPRKYATLKNKPGKNFPQKILAADGCIRLFQNVLKGRGSKNKTFTWTKTKFNLLMYIFSLSASWASLDIFIANPTIYFFIPKKTFLFASV